MASLLVLSSTTLSTLAATANVTQEKQKTEGTKDTTSANSTANSGKTTGQKVLATVIGIAILLAFLGCLTYMYIFLKKKYYTITSVQEMKQQRQAQNQSPDSSPEENQQAAELLEQALSQWSSYVGEDSETYFIPRKMIQVKRSVGIMNQAKAIMPTDEGVIDRMNELGGIINERTHRSFAGSWSLLGISFLVMLFFYFVAGGNDGFFHRILSLWWLWGSMIFYIMASYAPQFLIEKRMEWFGGKKFSSGLIKTVLAIVAATPATYTVVTKWSDGSTTKSEEGAGTFLFIMALAIIALIIIGTLIIFFGLINFLRNYILFF